MGRRSVSQLNLYSECGERYRLERVDSFPMDLPERPSPWTAVGNAMHSVYEIWERNDRQFDMPEMFLSTYSDEIESLFRAQPDPKWWIITPRVKSIERDIELRGEHGVKQAEALQTHCLESPWHIKRIDGALALELPVSLTFGAVEVVGKIDSVKEWPDGRVVATDLKTGNKKGTKNRQLGFYGLALREIYGLDVRWGEFWYTKLGASGGYIDLRRYTRDYLHNQFNNLDQAIGQRIFLANPGEQCGFCPVKQWCREMGNVHV